MRVKVFISLMMTLIMAFTALSLPVTATFSTDTISYYFKLNYNAEGGTINLDHSYKSPGTYYYSPNSIVNIKITPANGYIIKSITSEKRYPVYETEDIDDFNPTESYRTAKMMYCNRVITVEFAKTYTATALASPEEGGTATVDGGNSITTAAGVEVEFLAEPNTGDGYYFDGWYDGDSCVSKNESYSFEILTDTTLTAVFIEEQEEVYHQVILDTIGEGSVTGEGTYIHGTEVAVGATPGEGYTFVGWFEGQPILLTALSEDSDEEEDLLLVSEDNPYSFELLEDTFLIAKFVEATYQVTIEIIGEGTVTGDGPYDHGANLDVSATPDSGWHFDNWYYEGETLNPVEYPVTTDMAITAKFLKDQKSDPKPSSGSSSRSETKHTLNVSVEGDGSVLPEGIRTYSKGTTVVLVPTPNEGSVFMGWFGEDGGDVVDNNLLMNEDKSIIARFISEEEAVPETEEPVLEPEPDEEDIVVILDNEIPISSPVLPQTAGIPLELLLASGTLMITGGMAVRRKRRKN